MPPKDAILYQLTLLQVHLMHPVPRKDACCTSLTGRPVQVRHQVGTSTLVEAMDFVIEMKTGLAVVKVGLQRPPREDREVLYVAAECQVLPQRCVAVGVGLEAEVVLAEDPVAVPVDAAFAGRLPVRQELAASSYLTELRATEKVCIGATAQTGLCTEA